MKEKFSGAMMTRNW